MRDRIWTYGRFDGQTPELAVEHALRQVDTGLTALKGDPSVIKVCSSVRKRNGMLSLR